MSEIDVSDFCLVCYYNKETNKLAHIEHYDDVSPDIKSDIESYEYAYNATVVKPEQIIEQLQQLKAENEELKREKTKYQNRYQQLVGSYNRAMSYKQCFDNIEECIECCTTTMYGCGNCKKGDECNGTLSDLILQKIKQAKEN